MGVPGVSEDAGMALSCKSKQSGKVAELQICGPSVKKSGKMA